MTEFIFGILESIGFTHPLHPALTHIPMGMAMACFLFAVAGRVLNQPGLDTTAHHSAFLGLVGVPPTMLAGYMDWQHSWDGEWIFLIGLKIGLGVLLFLLFGIAWLEGRKPAPCPKRLMIYYALTLLCAIGLGFSGGELIYG